MESATLYDNRRSLCGLSRVIRHPSDINRTFQGVKDGIFAVNDGLIPTSMFFQKGGIHS